MFTQCVCLMILFTVFVVQDWLCLAPCFGHLSSVWILCCIKL